MRSRFFWVLVIYISVRINYRKPQMCWCRSRKVENLVCFMSKFDPYFPNIRGVQKRCKIYMESIGIYCKNIESIESMEVATLENITLSFCLKGTLSPNNSVQFTYDSVER